MQPDPILDLNLRGVRVHIVDELTPAAEGTQWSLAGPPSAHGLQHWPGPPRSLGGEDSPVLAPSLPQGEGEHDDTSGPLFGCNIPMQEHKHPPLHPPQLLPLELQRALTCTPSLSAWMGLCTCRTCPAFNRDQKWPWRCFDFRSPGEF